MSNELRIERMTTEHIETFYAINLEAFEDDPWPAERFFEFLEDPAAYYYAAYLGGKPAGFCGMYHNTSRVPHYCKITILAVKRDFRGKGIGRALMLKIFDTASALGLDRIKLEVNTKSGAVRLYEALGFKIEEVNERYYEKSGDDAYVMWRYD